MTEDKPLHVQVAEALGWTDMKPRADDGLWGGKAPDVSWEWTSPPRFDTDWAATGPLIERLRITVVFDCADGQWSARSKFYFSDGYYDEEVKDYGDTPLITVCRLILALKAAGKLEAA